jgi:hypothetical protein
MPDDFRIMLRSLAIPAENEVAAFPDLPPAAEAEACLL